MDALPSEGLPPGWGTASLETICDINPTTDISGLSGDAAITFVPMAAVGALTNTVDTSTTRPLREITTGFTRFQSGDVIFAKITPCMENGKIALVPELPGGIGIGSTEFHVVRPKSGIDPAFVCHYLMQESFRATARRSMSGAVGQQRVPAAFLREALIPLAPAAEQTRIVGAVSALFDEVEAGEAALAQAREGLTQFRASLLHAACTGALTADWRAANPTNETGEEVVRASLQHAGAVAQGKALKAEPSALPDNLPELPPSWRWARLWQLCHVTGGITVDAKRSGDDLVDVPYLRVANVQRGRLDLATVKSLKATPDQIARLLLRPNDVLLNEGGDRDKLGRGWVWDGQIEPCIHQNHVFRARPYLREFDGRFISHYLNELGRSYFFRNATQTVNLASISLRTVLGTPIPVPPLAEITEIVKRTAEIEATVAVPMVPDDSGARLRHSILHSAFTGRLVPQDPADEPAAALLARLHAKPAASPRPRARRTATQPDLIETPA